MQKVNDEQFFHRFNSGHRQPGENIREYHDLLVSVGARGRAECEKLYFLNKTHSGATEEEATSTSL